MSITDLYNQFRSQAQSSGAVTINSSAITGAGLTPPANLDSLLENSFGLVSGSALTIPTTKENILQPSPTTISIVGSVSIPVLSVSNVSIQLQFTADTNQLDFNALTTLPANWSFVSVFPMMIGFPFSEITLLEGSSVLAFSTIPEETYTEWSGGNISLSVGQNFAGLIQYPESISRYLALLPSGFQPPKTGLSFFGSIDFHSVDNETILYPDLDLSASLSTESYSLFFLNVGSPFLHFLIETFEDSTPSTLTYSPNDATNYVQTPILSLACSLDLELNGKPVDFIFETEIFSLGNNVNLVLNSDPAYPLTVEDIFQLLMNGQTWFGTVPPQLLQFLNEIEFRRFILSVSLPLNKAPVINSIGVFVGSAPGLTWNLFDDLSVTEFDVSWNVLSPLANPTNTVLFQTQFQFFNTIFKGGWTASIDNHLNVDAEFKGQVSFSDIVSAVTKNAIQIPSEFQLMFTDFNLYLQPNSKSYSFYASADASLSLFDGLSLTLEPVQFQIEAHFLNVSGKYAYSGMISGIFAIVDSTQQNFIALSASASYDGENQIWNFLASTNPGQNISLSAIANQFLGEIGLPNFLPGNLSVSNLLFSAQRSSNPESPNSSYSFQGDFQWTQLPLDTNIYASVLLNYNNTSGSKSTGAQVSGRISIMGAEVEVYYALLSGSQTVTLGWEGLSLQYTIGSQMLVFQTDGWSIGDAIAALVRAIFPGSDFQFSSPWDLLNEISLNGLKIEFDLENHNISVNYTLSSSIDLFFLTIEGFSITRDPSNDKIMVQINGTFKPTGESIPAFDATREQPPTTPGYGGLVLLALGQRVTVPALSSAPDIASAVKVLESAFQPPSDQNQVPVQSGGPSNLPVYDAGSQWLAAVHLLIVNGTIDISVLFNDPVLYGLHIQLSGSNPFAGLAFDILYKKVTDSIGVYQIELTLPAKYRTMNFGDVQVTLPSVAIAIFTNGNFKVDFGFPANMDFSKSFGVIATPFAGSGGFYFGYLSGPTDPNLPPYSAQLGYFQPVIAVGIGLNVGLGASVGGGIFSASMSLTVFGIFEGTFATWQPYSSQSQNITYYNVSGTLGIIAQVQGSINFAIIQASVNITLQVSAQFTLQSYRASTVALSVYVSVRITISINLGLFSIHIHLSFSTTISASFQIGSDTRAPWDPTSIQLLGSDAAMRARIRRRLTLLTPNKIRRDEWRPFLKEKGTVSLQAYFLAHPTITGEGATSLSQQVAQFSAMLYMDPTSFPILAQDFMTWIVGNLLSGTADITDKVSHDPITYSDLQNLLSILNSPQPFTYKDLSGFLGAYTISVSQASGATDTILFPMPADLSLIVPAYNGEAAIDNDFSKLNLCDGNYLTALQEYFSQLALSYQPYNSNSTNSEGTLLSELSSQSFAQFIFTDYFLLLARSQTQYALDALHTFLYPLGQTDSIQGILAAINSYGKNQVTISDLVSANLDHPLTSVPLTITGIQFVIQEQYKSLSDIASYYQALSAQTNGRLLPPDPGSLAETSGNVLGLIAAGITLTIGSQSYITKNTDTFASIAAYFQLTLQALGQQLTAVSLLAPASKLTVSPLTYTSSPSFDDTLNSLALFFNLDALSIATTNADVPGFFSLLLATDEDSAHAYLKLPVLDAAPLPMILSSMQFAGTTANLAGMASRYLLHGLRAPSFEGFSLPAGSLYSLTGQQFIVPPLSDSDANQYKISLKNTGAVQWIQFPDGSDTITISPDKNTIDALNAFLSEARSSGLQAPITSFSALSSVAENPSAFAFGASISLTLPEDLALGGSKPIGQQLQNPNIFPFSGALLSALEQPLGVPLQFGIESIVQSSEQPATKSPVTWYSWGALVGFVIRKYSQNIYEIHSIGADGQSILEELVIAMNGGKNDPVQSIQILYPPAPLGVGGQPVGLQGDGNEAKAFLVRSNLSTQANPPPSFEITQSLQSDSTVLNSDYDFASILWEGGIVNSGGYYLYYNVNGNGLPDSIFDGQGQATIYSLFIMSQNGNFLSSYMNCAITGDMLPSGSSQYAISVSYTPPPAIQGPGDSLAIISARYGMYPSDLAKMNSTVALNLNSDIQLQIVDIIYETDGSLDLNGIATRFETTPAAIQALNQNLQIDWNQIPPLVLLRIPDISLALSGSSGFKTLADISAYFGVSLESLGAVNASIANLFQESPPASLQVTAGLMQKYSPLPPGCVGFSLQRSIPDNDDMLESQYNLLAYQVLAIREMFSQSNEGMPAGPIDPGQSSTANLSESSSNTWNFQQIVPAYRFSLNNPLNGKSEEGIPDSSANPYAGAGQTLQLEFFWQDLFGNRTISPFSNPSLFAGSNYPLNNAPYRLGYTDRLIPLSEWPAVRANYLFQTTNFLPALSITFDFDPSRYDTTSDDWKRIAESDLRTYASIYYQINQLNSSGQIFQPFSLCTSLDGNQAHSFTTADFNLFLAFIVSAYQYISSLLSGNPIAPPVDVSYETPISPTQTEDVFRLTVEFKIERDVRLVDDSFRDELSVYNANSPILAQTSPTSNNTDSNPSQSISWFANQFEPIFATSQNILKIAVDSEGQIWVVRIANEAGGIGIYYNILNSPAYYAPTPLATSPLSLQAPTFTFDPKNGLGPAGLQTFTGINLDTWGAEFLAAMEWVLTPPYIAEIFRMDGGKSLNQILSAKACLAEAIAGNPNDSTFGQTCNILQNPIPTKDQLIAAREELRQRLLQDLTTAYTTTAIIQLPVQVTSSYSEGNSPLFYGIPTLDGSLPVALTASPGRIPLQNGTGNINITFGSSNIRETESLGVSISFQISHLQTDIQNIAGVEGYQSSLWLAFVNPIQGQTISLVVPILNRSFFPVPELTSQNYQSSFPQPGTALPQTTDWDYIFRYALDHSAQDTIECSIQLNSEISSERIKNAALPDLPTALAGFLSVWNELKRTLTTAPNSISTPGSSANLALQAFLQLACGNSGVAAAWSRWIANPTALSSRKTGDNTLEFSIQESSKVPTDPNTNLYLNVILPSGWSEEVPLVDIDGWTRELVTNQGSPNTIYSYYQGSGNAKTYLSLRAAESIPARNVTVPQLNVLAVQNAWAFLQVSENQNIIPGNPTLSAFVYQSQQVAFKNALTPYLPVTQEIRIDRINNPAGNPQALTQILNNLFTNLFSAVQQPSVQKMKLSCNYAYSENANVPDILLPVLFSTPFDFNIPNDSQGIPACNTSLPREGSSYVCQLAYALCQWFRVKSPQTNGSFLFEIWIYSDFTDSQMPVLDLQNLVLPIASISDLITKG